MVDSFNNLARQAQNAIESVSSAAGSLSSTVSSALGSLGLGSSGGGGGGTGGPAGDPFTSLRFWVEVESEVKAAFAIVSGLELEIEVVDYKEGGHNHANHKRITGGVKYKNLVLKQGVSNDDFFWRWIDEVRNGRVTRRTVTVILADPDNSRRVSWSFLRAFPVKWVGPLLQADSSEVAIQTIEFAHEGLIKS
jgi:phage tail-like protein